MIRHFKTYCYNRLYYRLKHIYSPSYVRLKKQTHSFYEENVSSLRLILPMNMIMKYKSYQHLQKYIYQHRIQHFLWFLRRQSHFILLITSASLFRIIKDEMFLPQCFLLFQVMKSRTLNTISALLHTLLLYCASTRNTELATALTRLPH